MKKILLPMIILVTAVLTSSPALAEVREGAFTISPFVGGYTFDGVQHINTNVAAGLRFGYNLTKNWGVEALFSHVPVRSTNAFNTAKRDQYGVRGDILYHFMPESRLVPFVALGDGWSKTVTTNLDNDDATLAYGGGVKYFLTDWLALRGDVRHIFSFHPSDQWKDNYWQNVEYTAGLTFQFDMPRPATPAVKEAMPVEEVKPPIPAPVEVIPPPVPAPASGPDEVILPGRLPSPQAPVPAPVPEPIPAPVHIWEGPTSWRAEKTEVPEGKILVTGFKIVQNSLEIIATGHCYYHVYTLAQPSRLVIDITNGLNGFRDNRIQINKIGISAVRLEDNPEFLRIILDSAQENLLPYRIEEIESGLKVIVTKPNP